MHHEHSDTPAVSHAARSLVLLGDPQQLEQPQQGSHPEGTNVSVLEHVLGEHKTIPHDHGIFLPETWRLAPSICAFTLELFYDGRLSSRPGLDRQVLTGTSTFDGAGLWVVAVPNSSVEDAEVVDHIASSLLSPGAQWIDHDGVAHAMSPDHILVVAPYNAQVALLEERLVPREAFGSVPWINSKGRRPLLSLIRWPHRRPRTRPAVWKCCTALTGLIWRPHVRGVIRVAELS